MATHLQPEEPRQWFGSQHFWTQVGPDAALAVPGPGLMPISGLTSGSGLASGSGSVSTCGPGVLAYLNGETIANVPTATRLRFLPFSLERLAIMSLIGTQSPSFQPFNSPLSEPLAIFVNLLARRPGMVDPTQFIQTSLDDSSDVRGVCSG